MSRRARVAELTRLYRATHADQIRRAVDQAPRLSREQVDALAVLFRPAGGGP